MALVGMAAGIRAGALDADEAAFVVDAERAGAVSVAGKNGEIVVRIEPAERCWAAPARRESAVFRADQTVGVVGSLPDELPLGSGGDDAGIAVTVTCFSGAGCGKRSASLPFLRDGDPVYEQGPIQGNSKRSCRLFSIS